LKINLDINSFGNQNL